MSGFSGSKIHKIKSLQVLGILTLALCVSACGGGSDEQTSSIAPINTPTDIKGTADAGNVVLSWSPVSGAESYNIYYSTDAALDIKNYKDNFDKAFPLKNHMGIVDEVSPYALKKFGINTVISDYDINLRKITVQKNIDQRISLRKPLVVYFLYLYP